RRAPPRSRSSVHPPSRPSKFRNRNPSRANYFATKSQNYRAIPFPISDITRSRWTPLQNQPSQNRTRRKGPSQTQASRTQRTSHYRNSTQPSIFLSTHA